MFSVSHKYFVQGSQICPLTHTCTHTHIYTHTYACMHTYICIHTHIHTLHTLLTYIHLYIYINIIACINRTTDKHVCMDMIYMSYIQSVVAIITIYLLCKLQFPIFSYTSQKDGFHTADKYPPFSATVV